MCGCAPSEGNCLVRSIQRQCHSIVCLEAYNGNVIHIRWACQEDDLLLLVVAIHLESGDPVNTSAVKKRYIALQVKL